MERLLKVPLSDNLRPFLEKVRKLRARVARLVGSQPRTPGDLWGEEYGVYLQGEVAGVDVRPRHELLDQDEIVNDLEPVDPDVELAEEMLGS